MSDVFPWQSSFLDALARAEPIDFYAASRARERALRRAYGIDSTAASAVLRVTTPGGHDYATQGPHRVEVFGADPESVEADVAAIVERIRVYAALAGRPEVAAWIEVTGRALRLNDA